MTSNEREIADSISNKLQHYHWFNCVGIGFDKVANKSTIHIYTTTKASVKDVKRLLLIEDGQFQGYPIFVTAIGKVEVNTKDMK